MTVGTGKLGFVGLGAMGGGMCRNLTQKSGCPVYAADLDRGNIERAVADGAVASTVSDISTIAEIVFLSLPTIDHVEEVCFGEQGLVVDGGTVRTIVDMSTSDVYRTRELARRLKEAGIRFLDAPVGRSREAANQGTLLITVGGAQELFEECLPLFKCMGSDVVLCGETGAGQAVKILNNMVLLSTVNSLAEAMAIAEQAGVEKARLVDVFGLGSASSFGLRLTGEQYLARDDFPEKLFPAAYALKDMKLALALAAYAGIDANLCRSTAALLESTVERGYGRNHYPVMYRLIKREPD